MTDIPQINLLAPAKINLSLNITGRLANGYHSLDTVFLAVDLFDTLALTLLKTPTINLSCSNSLLPCDENNIAFKAAKLFFKEIGTSNIGAEILLNKNIPFEAGMGGGSSDAAAVLFGLNKLMQNPLSKQNLLRLAAQIGADVPFFLVGGCAKGEGIGDVLTSVKMPPQCFFVIVKPVAGVSTKDAFKAYSQHSKAIIQKGSGGLLKALELADINLISNEIYNVFEELCPVHETAQIKSIMKQNGALNAVLCGSGSAVAGLFTNQAKARVCHQKLKKTYSEVFTASPFNGGVCENKF